MNKSDKSIWGLFAILVVVAVVVAVGRMWQPAERIPWRENLASAQAEAKAADKPMLLYFTASWCGPCQSLKHTTWADAKVESALSKYVPVKIDIDAHPDLAEKYRVEAVPHFIVMGADDKMKTMASGAMPGDEFIEWLGSGGR